MRNRTFVKKLITMVTALGLAISLCACSGGSYQPTQDTRTSEQKESDAIKRNNQKIHDTINQFLGFKLSDEFIEESELLYDSSRAGSKGDLCILVKQGKEDELLSVLEKHCGMEKNIGPDLVPDTFNKQYITELKTMYPIKNWEVSGTSIYLARKGTFSYLYIFA